MVTLYFLLCLIAGSFVLAGWHIVTRGEWQSSIDGKMIYRGKLLKFWSKFWEGYTVDKGARVIYDGLHFYKVVQNLENVMGMSLIDDRRKYSICEDGMSVYLHGAQSIAHFKINWWRMKAVMPDLCESASEEGNEYKMNQFEVIKVYFYEHKKRYRFPEWVRKPISSCIYCYGSIYGSIVWWTLHFANQMISLDQAIILWFLYCISLTVGAALVWKATK